MNQKTIDLIESLLTSDETVSPEVRDAILRAARAIVPKRKLINAKEAQEILGISRVTLREYVRRGLLEQVCFSSRKVRFDELAVRRLAYNGISGCHACNACTACNAS